MTAGVIEQVDPSSGEVGAVLARPHAYVHLHTPPQDVHALDVSGLLDPSVTMFGYRATGGPRAGGGALDRSDDQRVVDARGQLLGIGAIKDLGDGHAELKSMHTIEEARGLGVAGALVDHMLAVARERGLTRVSIETGAPAPFAPARALYATRGFEPCEAFAPYLPSDHSHFMTRAL